MCQAFEFKHLPIAGGLFDQNPVLLERFLFILHSQEEQRQKEEAAKKRKQMGPSSSKVGGSRPAY